jgi:hypothetical protein
MARTTYRKGAEVQHKDGRRAALLRRVRPYRQWRVQLTDGRKTWWWESEFTRVAKVED